MRDLDKEPAGLDTCPFKAQDSHSVFLKVTTIFKFLKVFVYHGKTTHQQKASPWSRYSR